MKECNQFWFVRTSACISNEDDNPKPRTGFSDFAYHQFQTNYA